MRAKTTKAISICLVLVMLLGVAPVSSAAPTAGLDAAVSGTAAYVYKTVDNPQVGSVGGEWAVIGLARSGYNVPDAYYQKYYATVEKYVKACGGELHRKKYTEYSRVILALTAIGKDPTDVAGYNLLTPLGDYDKTIYQGLNGPIWALIALDSGGYDMPKNPDAAVQATREMYVDRILACQLPDGGFSLFGGTAGATAADSVADPDITGMALQALAKYTGDDKVRAAADEALACLSEMQDADGGYSSWGTTNSESVVQVIVALTELGVPLDDARFVKNGDTLLDNLMSYRQADGGFLHTSSGGGSNQMATEQGFYALAAARRARDGKNSLYRMSDALSVSESNGTGPVAGTGLEGKNPDVRPVPMTAPGTTFDDVVFSDNIAAIEGLAVRGILNGYEDGTFRPDNTMTRAEFAATVVRALGLTPAAADVFSDVPPAEWYAPYVGAAYTYGIVTGRTETTFDPGGTITRQEAAVTVARAAELCGMETEMDTAAIRDMLSQFVDYVRVAGWAREALAFCYVSDILDPSALEIRPETAITRCEVAQMLFNMLGSANLL
jgi:hypothetical protein